MFEKFIKSLEENLKQIKALKENEFEVIVSTSTNDRSGESITQDGIDIKTYMKNPVILINHEYTVEAIIGKATKVWTEGKTTKARGLFSQTNPRAKLVQDLYNEGMLKAVSIGFIPLERKNGDVIEKSEMLEFSFVAVPCNPEALSTEGKELMQKGIKAGLIKEAKKDGEVKETSLKELMAEIKTLSEKVDNISKYITDDKVNEKEILKAKSKKEALQNVDRAVGEALKNIKFL